jgi:beta-glucosidase
VIGENATRLQAHGGQSSEIKAFYEISPLDGILRRVGRDVSVTFAAGYVAPAGGRGGRGANAAAGVSAEELANRAVAAARAADVAVFVGGLNHDLGNDCESRDRRDLKLPYGQDELIARIVEANPRTVVVLVSGSPVEMGPWLGSVRAVVQGWYGGMEAGNALARVLFGDVNPSGKLPCTFPAKLEDSPAHALGAFPGRDGVVRYDEGLLVGYRWFDTKGIAPLFPFGHGLSYTRFDYAGLRVTRGEGESVAKVEFDLANGGERAGAEVVQIYVHDVASSLPRPAKELKAFRKIALAPGERQHVEITLGVEAFAFYDPERSGWIAEPGEFRIVVGSSSRDVRLEAGFTPAEGLMPK